MQDMMTIDRGDRRQIAILGRPQPEVVADHCARRELQITRIGAPSRKAATFSTICGYELR